MVGWGIKKASTEEAFCKNQGCYLLFSLVDTIV